MYSVLYNTGMVKGPKKLIAVRIDPEAWHKARIASVTAQKPVGDWLAEAINEKIEREKANDD